MICFFETLKGWHGGFLGCSLGVSGWASMESRGGQAQRIGAEAARLFVMSVAARFRSLIGGKGFGMPAKSAWLVLGFAVTRVIYYLRNGLGAYVTGFLACC